MGDVAIEMSGRISAVEHIARKALLRAASIAVLIAGSSIVVRPGAAPSGNVYADFPTAFAAANKVQGPRIIEFDNTFGAITIPAGNWIFNRNDVEFRGINVGTNGSNAPTPVTVADGAAVRGVCLYTSLAITGNASAATATQIVTNTFAGTNITLRRTTITQAGAGFYFSANVGAFGTLGIYLEEKSSLVNAGGAVCNNVSNLVIEALSGGAIGANTINTSGGGATLVNIQATAGTVSRVQLGTAPTFTPQVLAVPASVIVWRPGGVAGANVLTAWADVSAASAAIAGPKTIAVDISAGAATIPAGVWAMSSAQDVTIIMITPPTGAGVTRQTLTISDGATFPCIGGVPSTTCIKEVQHANVHFSSLATPAMELGGATASGDIIFRDCGVICTGTTAPLVEVSGLANSGKVRLYEGSPTAGGLCFKASGTSTLQIVQDTQSVINGGTLGSDVGATVNVTMGGDAALFNRTQAALLGTTTVTLFATLSTLIPNRLTKRAVAQAAVGTPAGQIAGGAVSTNAPFTGITLVSQVANPNTGGRWRVHGSLEVTTSVAATVTVSITARPTLGGGNYVTQYQTQGQATAAPVTIPFDVIFGTDPSGGGFAKLPFDVNNSTDVGIQVDVSAGSITTVTDHGCYTTEEVGG